MFFEPAHRHPPLNHQGFTLVELLVVIAVIAVLAAIIIAAINPLEQIRRGRDAKVKQDIASIVKALESYYTSSAISGNDPTYPDNLQRLNALIASDDLRAIPTTPPDYTPTYDLGYGSLPIASPCCTAARLYTQLRSQREIQNAQASSGPGCPDTTSPIEIFWGWRSATASIGYYCNLFPAI